MIAVTPRRAMSKFSFFSTSRLPYEKWKSRTVIAGATAPPDAAVGVRGLKVGLGAEVMNPGVSIAVVIQIAP
jgi:hypothetical protein